MSRRRRRLRWVRRDKRSIVKGLVVVAALLVVGAGAVALGYMLSSHLVAGLRTAPAAGGTDGGSAGPGDTDASAPADGSDSDPAADDAEAGAPVVIAGSAVTLYAVQIGNFSTEGNAVDLAQQVQTDDRPAAVVADGGFRVWVGLFDADQPARNLSVKLKGEGIDSFVVPWTMAAQGQLPAVAGAAALGELIEALPSVTGQLAAVWTAQARNGRDWSDAAAAAQARVIELQDQALALAVPDELGALTANVIGCVQRASSLAAALQALAAGDLPTEETSVLTMDFIELAGEVAHILNDAAILPLAGVDTSG